MLLRTGGLPALVYGQANTGVSCSHLLSQRRAVASAGLSAGAGDLDMTLVVIDGSPNGKADPAYAAHCDPIASWAEAIWCAWLPIHMLVGLVVKALNDLANAKNVWATVRGPAGAFVASAQRLGWRVINGVLAIDDRQNEIHFERDSPAQIKFWVEQSVRRWRWRNIESKCPSLRQGDGGYGAHVIPLYRLVNTRKLNTSAWNQEHIGSLCSAVANRQWTQVRLAATGLASAPDQ